MLPKIDPVRDDAARPFWSVMLPTFNCSELFETALRSVLDQDPGPDRMEIVVVDDCSANGQSEAVVRRLAPSRVEYYRQPKNVGLAGNWNTCVARSRGHWVHILHQDDLIFPGFYERLGRASVERPDVGAAFCQHLWIDEHGNWFRVSPLERRTPGVIEDWLEKIAKSQRIECASIVIRREIYEHLGGFTTDLVFALDWEMWVRIAAHYPVWFEPKALACFRKHSKSQTSQLRARREDMSDIVKAFEIIERYMPAELRGEVGSELLPIMAKSMMDDATELLFAGDYRGGISRVNEACRYDPSLRFSRTRLNYSKWAAKLWLLDLLRGRRGRNGVPTG
jgi:glycosyltransferase involved in cell wall biosynthesis